MPRQTKHAADQAAVMQLHSRAQDVLSQTGYESFVKLALMVAEELCDALDEAEDEAESALWVGEPSVDTPERQHFREIANARAAARVLQMALVLGHDRAEART